MNPYPLILASTSKYRKALLSQLGWPFDCYSPEVDEDQFKSLDLAPLELAIKLSQLKANAIYLRHSSSCVIGSDQVCSLGKVILSKPGTFEKALEQLSFMQGKSHELITAVTLKYPQGEISFSNRTKLHMRNLSTEELTKYLLADEPYDCAGSYKLESKGIALFEKIEMDDHTSIIGLPLIQLTTHLLNIGYKI